MTFSCSRRIRSPSAASDGRPGSSEGTSPVIGGRPGCTYAVFVALKLPLALKVSYGKRGAPSRIEAISAVSMAVAKLT